MPTMETAPRHCYVHVPYCLAKCPYCDFNSVAGRESEFSAYVEALLVEVARLPRGPYDTVFVGGGTPTILPPAVLGRLCDGIRRHLHLADGYEWTVEANPGVADQERFAVLAEHGVNRLSLGVQALDEAHLRFLGRAHDAVAAESALARALATVPRVSADCIIGLPGQTEAQLDAVLDLYPRHGLVHGSVYHLAIEPGTEFHARHRRGRLTVLDEERSRALLERAWEGFALRGLPAYETSNFAAVGQACRHNLGYWQGHDYVAAGAGAVATVAGVRTTREAHPGRYIAAIRSGGDAVVRREDLDREARIREAWMLGLRLVAGLEHRRLAALGDPPGRWLATARSLESEGLIELDDNGLRLTLAGRALQDAITVALMP